MLLNFLFALVGVLVGGVINLLADDLPQRVRPQAPRCIQCRYDFPPAAWLALGRRIWGGGRCPQCGLPTRRRTLLVEIGSALLFAVLPFFLDGFSLIFGALYVSILILVIVTDLEHRLILHAVTVPGTLLALVGSLFIEDTSILLALLAALIGFVTFFAFFWLGHLLFGPGSLGFGDVTLATMMGAMLGFPDILMALIIGILLAGVITTVMMLARLLNRRSYVAYGPFLAAGGILVILWGDEILRWYLS